MKKLVFALIAMATLPAAADYFKTETRNCDPRAMQFVLDDAVRAHKAVITEVSCESVRVLPRPVYVDPEPMYYGPVYEPVYVPMVNYDYIPVVDCVPGPTSREYCGGCR